MALDDGDDGDEVEYYYVVDISKTEFIMLYLGRC